jgi:pimeloyl-ACP methyl ester carboxylesterase
MRWFFAALTAFVATATPARGQVFDHVNLDRLNGKLHGRVVDHTQNHGADRRIYSPILGRPRDLYVYLPPGYSPSVAYPLIVFLHGADIDEHDFLDPDELKALDWMISTGQIPPVVIAAPDGTYDGKNRIISTHSLWVNGLGGPFEDHVIAEVVPFLMQNYSIHPDRGGHALLGISAGGYGAMAMALRYRDIFGAVATIAGPLNMPYDNCQGRYGDDFNPATCRERTVYDPNMLIARFYFGLVPRRVKTYLEPVYGPGPDIIAKVARDNPADLLQSTNLRPGELQIYINYPDRDNFNFDAQDQSFIWLASLRGVHIDVSRDPRGRHNLSYIERAEPHAYLWLGNHILPPTPR